MTSLRRAALITILSALALGCGDDDGADSADAATADASAPDAAIPADATPPPDARQANLSCLGDPLPGIVAEMVTISGSVFTVTTQGQMSPVAGAAVQGFRIVDGDDDELIASDTSSATGAYSLTADTSEEPVDAYIRATHDDYLDTYVYPPVAVTEDLTGVAVVMLDAGTPGLFGFLTGHTQDNAKGFGLVAVIDCDGAAVHGAVVTTDPPAGNVAYTSGGLPSGSGTATDSDGLAFLQSVPVDAPVEIKATYMGMELRTVTIPFTPVTEALYSTALVP